MGCTQSTASAEPQQPEATTASGATDQPAAAAVVAAPTSTTTGTVAKTEATVPLTSDATPEVPVVDGQEVTIVGHSIDAKGVVLYHIQTPATDGSDQPVIVKKRFNEFKQFHRQVSASSTDAPVLPALPSAGLFTTFQRTQDTLIKTRSARLQEILQAASRDQVVAFVAEQPKTPEVVVDEARRWLPPLLAPSNKMHRPLTWTLLSQLSEPTRRRRQPWRKANVTVDTVAA
ncbi:hypothetical protein AaE_014506 [Aphanomyces astaci]|uniref:PX domain-containing protein n=1 Tax=Aphanomyces astaci TaxID=112090 RepID=A0A6A4Z6J1_APHAT|nr:hypothetical protein AaE_014506 [Aphanomyces astaci]